jgi:uncharacterized protein YdeI (YjbR/CyaY-like superfamily)
VEEQRAFVTAAGFESWLKRNHSRACAIWIRFFKKDSGKRTITYAEALDVALCYGWIDAQLRPLDEESWIRRFVPRRPRSAWSARNAAHALRLIREGRMRPAGLAQVRAAQEDGRWKNAYDSPAAARPPADFLRELRKDARAHAFFKSLNRANVYAIIHRLQTARKPETRERRLRLILEMMRKGQKFHPGAPR